MKTFYLIDGHALCYRAYYAFAASPLINSKGQNTSAIFGFARMVLQLVREAKPDYIAVAFDPPDRSFRFELYNEYKANRQKMPDDLRSQIEEIKELVRVFGFAILIAPGYEADDVLGTIAKSCSSEQLQVMLVTGDKDAYQLVADNVKIYANTKGVSEYKIYDREAVIEKIGLPPEKIIDYMALTGDTSDNVPGVKGVGPKTAQKLVSDYGSLDAVYEHVNELKGKLREQIGSSKPDAYLSRDLVTIRTDVPLDFSLDLAAFNGFSNGNVAAYFERLEMRSLAKEFSQSASPRAEKDEPKAEIKITAAEYTPVTTRPLLKSVFDEIRRSPLVSIDTETTSVRPLEAELVGVSISLREGQGWYFPLQSGGLFNDSASEYSLDEFLQLLKEICENTSIAKVGQNIKYDMLVLSTVGIEISPVAFDSMIASYLIDPEMPHNMDDLAEKYLSYKTITYEEMIGTGKSKLDIRQVPLEEITRYAAEDSDITLRLCNTLRPLIEGSEKFRKLFYEMELPLVPVLAKMERAGIMIDIRHFADLSRDNMVMIADCEKKIYEHAGARFNINSTRELGTLLFEKLQLPPVKKNKTGYSTDISVLESLKNAHPVVDELIRYRTLAKLKNTYIDVLPGLADSAGRIHTSFNQSVVATGRLSSSDPNLQNIPARDDFGKKLRRGFVAPEGFMLLSADYSQIELRLAAHISGDSNMISAFAGDTDIHRLTAAKTFNVDYDKVEDWMRRQAKIINFSTIYGVSPFGLSKQADISIHEAKAFIDRYFESYPGFREYIDRTVKFARENGYVETLCGRRRFVREIASSVQFRREGAERIAINTPIQGSSADLIKIAMVRIDAALSGMRSRILLQVHDELVLEVHESEIEKVSSIVKENMEHAMDLSVPLAVDIGTGRSWGDAH